MRKLFVFFCFLAFASMNAQELLTPGDTIFETKYVKPEKYQMKWYIVKDTSKHEVARINTEIKPEAKKLFILSTIDVNNAKTSWRDSTVVDFPSLRPIKHYSENLERGVRLKFGTSVTGSYNDKMNKKKYEVSDAVEKGKYFDSNSFSYLIRLLPLKEGYTQKIATYDYSPLRHGIITAEIVGVKTGTYRNKRGLNLVWIVTARETVKGYVTETKYYIDKTDRKIYKQEIFDGGLHTLIERVD